MEMDFSEWRVQRFWEKVVKTDGCWLWIGARHPNGYGNFTANTGQVCCAHRYAYELLVDKIPPGMTIDHICKVRNCVNPDHLRVMTQSANSRIGYYPNRDKTHCKRGHPLSGENLRITSTGGRACRECGRIWSREKYSKLHGGNVGKYHWHGKPRNYGKREIY